MLKKILHKTRLITGLLFFSTACIVWLYRQESPETFFAPEQILTDEPDAFITEGRYSTFTENGALSSLLITAKAVHYPKTDLGILENPQIDIYQSEGEPWKVTAKKGELKISGNELKLEGDVKVDGVTKSGESVAITSPRLIYQNKQHFIKTDSPVTIKSPSGAITAVGMDVSLDDKKIRLHSQVRGEYVAP